jgi:EF hand
MSFKSTTIALTAFTLSLGALQAAKPAKAAKPGKEGPYDAAEVVKKFDKNADNKLSLEEFSAMKKFSKETDPKAAAKTAFEALDADKDSFVTAEEMKAAHEKKVAAPKDGKPTSAPAKAADAPAK